MVADHPMLFETPKMIVRLASHCILSIDTGRIATIDPGNNGPFI